MIRTEWLAELVPVLAPLPETRYDWPVQFRYEPCGCVLGRDGALVHTYATVYVPTALVADRVADGGSSLSTHVPD